jgi:hypothetical protein
LAPAPIPATPAEPPLPTARVFLVISREETPTPDEPQPAVPPSAAPDAHARRPGPQHLPRRSHSVSYCSPSRPWTPRRARRRKSALRSPASSTRCARSRSGDG